MLTTTRTNNPLFLGYNDFRNSASNWTNPRDYSALTGFSYPYELTRSAADFVNTAVVNYTGGTVEYSDPVSVAAIGTYEQVVNTVLASSTDADYLARRIVAIGTNPGYRINELRLDLSTMTNVQLATEVTNRPGRRIITPTIYTSGPTEWVVQGFTDQFDYSATSRNWYRTYYVVDRAEWDAAQRWQDVTSGVTWATVNGTYKWTDLERFDI